MFIGELRCLQERKCGQMRYLQERYVKDVRSADVVGCGNASGVLTATV